MALAFLIRLVLSAALIAIIALIARKSPGLGGLIASLPLVSTLGMVWLWVDTRNAESVANYAQSAFWYFLPSIPMFLLIPFMLRSGVNFWVSMSAGIVLTLVLYLVMNAVLNHAGVKF